MRQRPGPGRFAACAAVLVVVLAACGAGDAATSDEVVLVGTGPEAESQLLAEVTAALVRDGGLDAQVVPRADADDARRALEVGDVDVLPSYTGEAWLRVLGREDPPSEPGTSLARVREFDERSGLVWLRPSVAAEPSPTSPPADATFAFVVRDPGEDVRTMSQLAASIGQLDAASDDRSPRLCVAAGFADDGLPVLLEAYQIATTAVELVEVGPAAAVEAVAQGRCVAGLTSATDGAAWSAGLRPLIDDLGVFPAFVVAPVVRDDALLEHDGLEEALEPMLEELTTARLGRWNARVVEGEDPAAVAADAVAELTADP